jgi:hypothetical protein
MKKSVKLFIILTALLLEFAWFAWPRLSLHGPILDESYRHDERLAALGASSEHPSPETKAAFDREVALLDRHMSQRTFGILAAVLAFDAVGIYFFWRYEPTKRTTA